MSNSRTIQPGEKVTFLNGDSWEVGLKKVEDNFKLIDSNDSFYKVSYLLAVNNTDNSKAVEYERIIKEVISKERIFTSGEGDNKITLWCVGADYKLVKTIIHNPWTKIRVRRKNVLDDNTHIFFVDVTEKQKCRIRKLVCDIIANK